jgi:pyruvate/2-oxoglutarate dehydrogenase complex dihydrolipoamide dehydrogenase (E3) component
VLCNLNERGHVHAECSPIRIDRLDSGDLRLTYAHRLGEKSSVDVDTVLMATGRRPRTAGMDLEVCSCTKLLCNLKERVHVHAECSSMRRLPRQRGPEAHIRARPRREELCRR